LTQAFGNTFFQGENDMLENFRTYQLAVQFYRLCQSLKLPRHLSDELARASSSVSLNLAEGAGRHTKADQRRFFHISFGSLRECQAILDLDTELNTEAKLLADKLAAHLYRLSNPRSTA
jgi:four helix bundle protein